MCKMIPPKAYIDEPDRFLYVVVPIRTAVSQEGISAELEKIKGWNRMPYAASIVCDIAPGELDSAVGDGSLDMPQSVVKDGRVQLLHTYGVAGFIVVPDPPKGQQSEFGEDEFTRETLTDRLRYSADGKSPEFQFKGSPTTELKGVFYLQIPRVQEAVIRKATEIQNSVLTLTKRFLQLKEIRAVA